MPEGRFTCNDAEIKFHFDSSSVSADKGQFTAILTIPLNMVFHPKFGGNAPKNGPKGLFCHLVGLEAKLKFQNSIVATDSSFPNRPVYFTNDNPVSISFPIEKEKIAILEKHRKKDIDLSLSISLVTALYSGIKTSSGQEEDVISKFSWANGETTFKFSQSEWISLLPKLGFKAFELVEVPISNELIAAEFAQSIAELKQAKHYLDSGDYDKVVAHCRTALEPIRGRFPNLKDHVKKNLSSDWIDTVNNATLEWLDKIFKFQADITNKTHHVPSIGHFSKNEAEAVYLLTVATISIGGNLESIVK